jgi:hypothetical protein
MRFSARCSNILRGVACLACSLSIPQTGVSVPDVIAIHCGQVFAIELKTERGRATDTQLQAIEDIRAA